MDCTPDRALIYAIIQGGVNAFQQAKSVGIEADHLLDFEERKIYSACETIFLPKGRMPSLTDIKQHLGIELEPPTDQFDADLCAKDILRRTLMTRLHDGLGPIEDQLVKDPFAARDALGELVKSTNWALGQVARTSSPYAIDEVMKRYMEAKARDGGLLGFSSPWPSRDKMSLGLQPGEVTVLLAKRKSGKCVAAGTLITCPTTGERVPVEDFVRDGSRLVYTWGSDKGIHAVKPDAYIDTGTKECFRVRWRSGRELVATPEHPLMTTRGWRRLDELQAGQHTAAVARVPEPTKTVALYDDECTFLAFMIAEGGCTKLTTATFTNSDPEIVEEMRNCIKHMRCELTQIERDPITYYVTSGGKPNKATALLREFGILGKKSIDKMLSKEIFSLDDHQLALFLGRLWSCDGSIDAKGVVSYSTGSRRLADQVQHLLLRFGVSSRVRTMKRPTQGGVRDYFEVIVRKDCVDSFKESVGKNLIGAKTLLIGGVTFGGKSRVGWIKNEELWPEIHAEMSSRPELVKMVGDRLGYQFRFQKSHVTDVKSGRIRRKVFEAFCSVYDSPLKWTLNKDICWDEIESIQPVGEQRVFDLTVIPTHCFVANDVLVHNTWLLLKWVEHIWTAKDKAGKPELGPGESILIVSMEMPVWQVLRRLFAIHQKLDYEKFRSGQLDPAEEKRFVDWCEEMKRPDPNRAEIIVVASDRVRTVDDIVGMVAQYRPKAVFIDSFYILDVKNARLQMWERMIYNIKSIKLDIAAAFSVPVLTTTQLSGQVKKGDLSAEADAVAYAKAIGDYADAIDGIFGNDNYKEAKRRILRGMEAREYKTIDLEIEFDPGLHKYGELRVLDKVEEGDGKSLDSTGDEDSGDAGLSYDEDTIVID